MPDLGQYSTTVLSAYGVALTLLAVIILVTWLQARRARRLLDEAEARRDGP